MSRLPPPDARHARRRVQAANDEARARLDARDAAVRRTQARSAGKAGDAPQFSDPPRARTPAPSCRLASCAIRTCVMQPPPVGLSLPGPLPPPPSLPGDKGRSRAASRSVARGVCFAASAASAAAALAFARPATATTAAPTVTPGPRCAAGAASFAFRSRSRGPRAASRRTTSGRPCGQRTTSARGGGPNAAGATRLC